MQRAAALGGGVVGAIALTALHETARRVVPHAPRVDVVGMRAIAQVLMTSDQPVPSNDTLYYMALVGDLVSNAAYYSLVGFGNPKNVWLRGALLGAAAGVGAALLPRPLGLGRQPGEREPNTQVMTVAWYLAGGLVAAAVAQGLSKNDM